MNRKVMFFLIMFSFFLTPLLSLHQHSIFFHPSEKESSLYFAKHPLDKKQLNQMICRTVFAKDYIKKLDKSLNYNLSSKKQQELDIKNSAFRNEMNIYEQEKTNLANEFFPDEPEEQTLENYQNILEIKERSMQQRLGLDPKNVQMMSQWIAIRKKIKTVKDAQKLFKDTVDNFDDILSRYVNNLYLYREHKHIFDLFFKNPSCIFVLLGITPSISIDSIYFNKGTCDLLKKIIFQINPKIQLHSNYFLYNQEWINLITNNNVLCVSQKEYCFLNSDKVIALKDCQKFLTFMSDSPIDKSPEDQRLTSLSEGIISGIPIGEVFFYSKYNKIKRSTTITSKIFLSLYHNNDNIDNTFYFNFFIKNMAQFSSFRFQWRSISLPSIQNFNNNSEKQWLFYSNVIHIISKDSNINELNKSEFTKGVVLFLTQFYSKFVMNVGVSITQNKNNKCKINLTDDQTIEFIKYFIMHGLQSVELMTAYNEMLLHQNINDIVDYSFLKNLSKEKIQNFKTRLERIFKKLRPFSEKMDCSPEEINKIIEEHLYLMKHVEQRFLKNNLDNLKSWLHQQLSWQKHSGEKIQMEHYHPIDPVSMRDLMKIVNRLEDLNKLEELHPFFNLYKILFFTIHLPFCSINTNDDIAFMKNIATKFNISLEYERWA